MGFYMGGKNESAPFVFSQLKTEKTKMGYTFLTAADTQVDGESEKKIVFNHETLMIFRPWPMNLGSFFQERNPFDCRIIQFESV